MKMKQVISVITGMVLSMVFASACFANDFDGGVKIYNPSASDPGVTSIYADIFTPTYPAVYTNSTSSAWPMITDSTDTKYVQVGWWDFSNTYSGSGVHYFFEYNDGTDYQVYNTYGPAQNTTHGYRVELSNGVWSGTAGGATIGTHSSSYKGAGIQYNEEIGGSIPYNAAFAGTSTDHAIFSNMRMFYNNITYYSPIPGSNFSAAPDGAYDLSNYISGSSSSTVDLWDTRY